MKKGGRGLTAGLRGWQVVKLKPCSYTCFYPHISNHLLIHLFVYQLEGDSGEYILLVPSGTKGVPDGHLSEEPVDVDRHRSDLE